MLHVFPLHRTIRRGLKFWQKHSYEDFCDSQWQLSPPPVHISHPRAVFLENQLDKIKGTATNLRQELDRVTGAWTENRGTTAYLLKNVFCANGCFYKDELKIPIVNSKESLFPSGELQRIDHAVLGSSFISNKYFGHFILDELPLTLAAQELGQVITVKKKSYSHEPGYRELLNVYAESIELARIKEIVIIDDISFNDYKAERFQALRLRLREKFKPVPHAGVYIRRGLSGSRRLLTNEQAVEKFLESRGFKVIDPEVSSAEEIIKQSIDASIVIGVEGSQLSPGLLAVKDKGAILALQPPTRFNAWYKVHADGLDLTYSFVVGDKSSEGFSIDLQDLEKTLALL